MLNLKLRSHADKGDVEIPGIFLRRDEEACHLGGDVQAGQRGKWASSFATRVEKEEEIYSAQTAVTNTLIDNIQTQLIQVAKKRWGQTRWPP